MATITLESGQLFIISGAIDSVKESWVKKNVKKEHVLSINEIRKMLGVKRYSSKDEGLKEDIYFDSDKVVFDVAKRILEERLAEGQTVFLLSENLSDQMRSKWVQVAYKVHVKSTLLIFIDSSTALKAKKGRPKSIPGPEFGELDKTSAYDHVLLTGEEKLKLVPKYIIPRGQAVDYIGDVHGLFDKFIELLDELGYDTNVYPPQHREGRKICLLGDMIDRGPDSIKMLQISIALQKAGHYVILGNHERKMSNILRNHINGKVQTVKGNGLRTLNEIKDAGLGMIEIKKFIDFIDNLPHYYIHDLKVPVALVHAPITFFDPMSTPKSYCIYGSHKFSNENTDKVYSEAFIAKKNKYILVHGHNRKMTDEEFSISLDRGQAYGGQLAALRCENINEESVILLDSNYNYVTQKIKELKKEV